MSEIIADDYYSWKDRSVYIHSLNKRLQTGQLAVGGLYAMMFRLAEPDSENYRAAMRVVKIQQMEKLESGATLIEVSELDDDLQELRSFLGETAGNVWYPELPAKISKDGLTVSEAFFRYDYANDPRERSAQAIISGARQE